MRDDDTFPQGSHCRRMGAGHQLLRGSLVGTSPFAGATAAGTVVVVVVVVAAAVVAAAAATSDCGASILAVLSAPVPTLNAADSARQYSNPALCEPLSRDSIELTCGDGICIRSNTSENPGLRLEVGALSIKDDG